MNRKLLAVLLLLAMRSGVIAMSDAQSELRALLPDTIQGWITTDLDRTYDRNNLFDYINGGAELYLSYDFRRLAGRTYSTNDQPDLIVDVFDMGTSENAYGVFTHSRETVDDTFGQGSQYTEGLLLFWKDRYYVSILASPETETSKKACMALAGHIDDGIPTTGPLPQIVSLLPDESLAEETVRYFHHYIWLNSHYFIADENILHIDENTDAVLAKYGDRGQQSILLLVQYANDDDARTGHEDFVRYYLPEQSERNVVQIEDQTWAGCELRDRLLAVVLAAPTEDAARTLMETVYRERGAE
jgi:hypothetical protein